jgi:hypothetical protein
MKVLVGPCAGVDAAAAIAVARALAGRGGVVGGSGGPVPGEGGLVVPLREVGVTNLSRRLSAAEVALLRRAMRDARDGSEGGPEAADRVIGYVCGGRPAAPAGCEGGATGEGAHVVVVEDHVNLTWRSPLLGPNDDSAGPRFPSMTGIYVPELAAGRLSAGEGMIVRTGVVAGVLDSERLNGFESDAVARHAYAAVSSELVPVVIVAAHLGLQVAAAIVAA